MKADKVLREIERLARSQFLPIIGPDKGKVLLGLVKKYKPKRILEVGTLVGYSAILMAKQLTRGGKILSLEINPELAKIAKANSKKAGVDNKVEVVVGDALFIIPALKGSFDFLFLDASKEEYLDYLKLAEAKLAKGSVIVADNVKIFQSVLSDYLSYVRNSGKYKSKTYDCGSDALEVSLEMS